MLSIQKIRCDKTFQSKQYLRFYISMKEVVFGDDHSRVKSEHSLVNKEGLPICTKLNGRYVSPWAKSTNKQLIDAFKYHFSRQQQRLKMYNTKIAIQPVLPDLDKLKSVDHPHNTWIGHATVYTHVEGLFFVSDPMWSSMASPSKYFGPKRYIEPPIELSKLPIDVVLLSHTHYDHLDLETAKIIGNKALWIVPLGVKDILAYVGITNIIELNWWDSHTIKSPTGNEVRVVFTPTKHWTARTIFDRNTCLWGAYAVISPRTKYFFSGDTAYCSVFKQIGEMFGGFDVSTIPIGAYAPRWFMKDVHCDPAEAIQIHKDLQSKKSIGIHWGTFPMADEDYVEPALELARTRESIGMENDEFFTMAHGETLFMHESSQHDLATKRPDLLHSYLTNLSVDIQTT